MTMVMTKMTIMLTTTKMTIMMMAKIIMKRAFILLLMQVIGDDVFLLSQRSVCTKQVRPDLT